MNVSVLQGWVREAQSAAREWRQESWRDMEMYDGGRAQWLDEDYEALRAAGITPITINRTFPTVNLVLGAQAVNRQGMIVKGRTGKDAEISQVMGEGLQYDWSSHGADEFTTLALGLRRGSILSGFVPRR